MSLTLYDHAATMMTSTAAAAPPMVSTPLRLADPVNAGQSAIEVWTAGTVYTSTLRSFNQG